MSDEKYIFTTMSDHGTVLKADQTAVVYDEENGYQIFLANHYEDGAMPEAAAILVAVALRLTNEKVFYDEMVKWLESKQ